MNMFKKSKKAKDQDDGLGSFGADVNPVSKASRALTRKKKRQPEAEEKPVFDIAAALPDSNDFRTSLLMPNLSARFSMLREQDDPTTKVGKASDDSVLFPERASRMNLFNNSQLTDIAEVESIRSGFRPPFADNRNGSFSDGYASDDGASMMNRSRQGDGNNFFGGRQKLYKINATSSAKDLPSTSMSSKKHTYENDTSLSAFQQYRRREKEGREEQRDAGEEVDRNSYHVTEYDEHDSARSPGTGFSHNRGTQSSTNSGPSNGRTSTAATSVVSESPLPHSNNHVINKVKEIDANSSAESIGFASSPGLRTYSTEEGRHPLHLSGSRSVANIRDKHSRQSPVPTFRALSPPANAMAELDFGLKETRQPVSSQIHQTASPVAQFDFDQNEALAGSVRPKDHGKATAMGLFNKPARHYDDIQFQQRQVQMHEGRNSPVSISSRAASRASLEPTQSNRPSYASTANVVMPEDSETPQIPPIPGCPPSPVSNRRSSATSTERGSASRPRTKSIASAREAVVKARVESLIRRQNAELAAREVDQLGPTRSVSMDDEASTSETKPQNGTFYDDSDYSEDELPQSRSPYVGGQLIMPTPPPPTDVHPALRKSSQSYSSESEERNLIHSRNSNSSTSSKGRTSSGNRHSEHDSGLSSKDREFLPGPTTGLGLSGLIRTHLRQDSDKSSMLPPPSPALLGIDSFRISASSTARTVTESVKSDPFEYDNQHLSPQSTQSTLQSSTPTTLMSRSAQQILENAKAIRDAQVNEDTTPKIDISQPVQIVGDDEPSAVIDGFSHQRNESTETQREIQRFDAELAERRKRIEEGLKSVQERSRSRSPIAERSTGSSHGFSLPRFPGRSNTGDRAEPPIHNKAMKLLGISSPRDQQHSPKPLQEPHMSEHDRRRNMRSRQGQRQQGPEHQNGRSTPNSGRATPRTGDRPPHPRSITPSNRGPSRNRSNSAVADQSVQRTNRVPDFDPRTMPGSFPHSPYNNNSPSREFGQRSTSPAAYNGSASSLAGHRSERNGYFASKSAATSEMSDGFGPQSSPRPLPRPSPYSVDTAFQPQTTTPLSPSSSVMPSTNAAVNGRTTPSSNHGRTTPSSTPGRATPSGTRKRSVTKYMISEPMFVSSTSTIPLVHLPKDGGPAVEAPAAPPVPAMNPRRRGTGAEEQSSTTFDANSVVHPRSTMSPTPDNPGQLEGPSSRQHTSQSPPSRPSHRLRKSSSEGGNMAARARQQALAVELAREKSRSPNVAAFPNRSATSLATQEGGMF